MYRVKYPGKYAGDVDTEDIEADDVTSNMSGALFLHRKTGRMIQESPPFEGEKNETEVVAVFAAGWWKRADKRASSPARPEMMRSQKTEVRPETSEGDSHG